MNSSTDIKVYTTATGQAVIEHTSGTAVVLTSEQILAVIRELHVCYDYCASWRDMDEAPASEVSS